MKTIPVKLDKLDKLDKLGKPGKLDKRSYPIEIEPGLIADAGARIRALLGDTARRAIIVANNRVDALYGARVLRSLRRAGFRAETFLIGDGERFKSLRTAEAVYTFLIERRAERSDLIVALGGGVTGDLAGFVAATYLRGIRFVQIPTTLLAQIDSSVGGKTGVNHRLGKNLIGAFHQPSLVVIDPETLRTLPARELNAGLYEAIKYGVIRDARFLRRISARLDRIKSLDTDELVHMIARSCEIKADVVARDEREGGLRRILNFGHTVGHALEAVSRYRRFLHGEAVGHGMRAASLIAERVGLLAPDARRELYQAISEVGRLPAANNLALDGIMSAMAHDKKAEAGRITFVLPVEIGRVVVKSGLPPRLVRSALKDALT
ncbi:MAG TPA: 3-dehydroquinate synthase [Blastocatellia bacterium]|nr:3-dehydroquinate synthase [Blastocatellia bacterium]